MDNSFWMKLIRDWTSKPWVVVRSKTETKLKVPTKNEKQIDVNKSMVDKVQQKSFSNQDYFETLKNEMKISNLNFEEIRFLEMKAATVLEQADVERIGIHPNFFQIKSKFFYFCFAIDTSELEEVCENNLKSIYLFLLATEDWLANLRLWEARNVKKWLVKNSQNLFLFK